MPPSKDDPRPNPLEGPGDYTTTSIVHSDTYDAISPLKFPPTNHAVFISGASKGIGRQIAVSYARAGASRIAVTARSSLESLVPELKAAAKEAGREEPKVLPLEVDITSQKSVEAAAKAVEEEFGTLDVLINNAGILAYGKIGDVDPDVWWSQWETNVKGTFLTSKYLLPLLLKGGGKTIITIASVGAHLVGPSLSAYQASKLAQLRLAEFISAEYGDQGIISYTVHPGNVPDTSILGGSGPAEHLKFIFTDKPQLAADTLTFLSRERRKWLAGRYLNVSWDMPEMMQKESDIAGTDKLKVRLVL